MHYNTGYQREAIPLIRHFVEVFKDAKAIVAPSASCAGMVRDLYPKAAALSNDSMLIKAVELLILRVYELSEFLVKRLGVIDVGPITHTVSPITLPATACACCMSATRLCNFCVRSKASTSWNCPTPASAAVSVAPFAIKNADTSLAMLSDKMRCVLDTGAEVLCAADASCLMHIGGRLHRQRAGVATVHLAEILANTESEAA